MPNEISVIPSALEVLGRELSSAELEVGDLFLRLRALQRMGLSRSDLIVHIERLRASNEATVDDEVLEDNALLALDLIEGESTYYSLRWDPAEITKILLPQILTKEDLTAGIPAALAPSNMLPPRSVGNFSAEVAEGLRDRLWNLIERFEIEPEPADFFRVPKSGMTTRPAALLSPHDRLTYETLAQIISSQLDHKLPRTVSWPRGRADDDAHSAFASAPSEWPNPYVVVADIDSFYECVDHTILANIVATQFQTKSRYPQMLEAFLDAISGSSTGLPQGPAASDVFASAYLLEVDSKMYAEGWTYVRYADDYLIGVNSIVDGKQRIETLESALYSLGLRLNTAKTKVMRKAKYLRSIEGNSPRVERLRGSIKRLLESQLRQSESPEEIERILTSVGADEQIIWDLLYHQSTTLDDVIDQVKELLRPSLVDAYARYFNHVTINLARGNLPQNMLDVEQDLRECLTFLASAARIIDLNAVDEAFKWFPRLAPNVASYLKEIAPRAAEDVAEFLSTWVTSRSGSDWVTAWMCHVAEAYPPISRTGLLATLKMVARDANYGLLTRSSAIRALAASGQLDTESWNRVIVDASPAILSELILSRSADPSSYPRSMPAIDRPTSLGDL